MSSGEGLGGRPAGAVGIVEQLAGGAVVEDAVRRVARRAAEMERIGAQGARRCPRR